MSSPSRWTEVRIAVPQGWHELIAASLDLGPCTSVVVGVTSIAAAPPPSGCDWVRTYVSAANDTPALRTQLVETLRALAESTGDPELANLEPQFHPLPPEDYATSWRKSWKPFRLRRAGRAVVVLPSWDDEHSAGHGELLLQLEPGGSFGSGRHATTRTCMGLLLERIRGGERVLDAGCGSGVLAVLATLCGADSSLGFDVDPGSRPAAEELARDNGAGERCSFLTAGFEVLADHPGPYDVVLANIYSDVIQERADSLREALAPGGWFAFSGCPVHHLDATRSAIAAAGLEVVEERPRGRWWTFLGRLCADRITTG